MAYNYLPNNNRTKICNLKFIARKFGNLTHEYKKVIPSPGHNGVYPVLHTPMPLSESRNGGNIWR